MSIPPPRDVDVRLLERADAGLFENVADGVFDHAVDPSLAREFLDDPRHHIAIAVEGGQIVGFVSAVDYIHPDKPRELWINEVGVAPRHQGSGIGKRLVQLMLDQAKAMGCAEAWVLTDADNGAANALYQAVGGKEKRPGQRMYVFRVDGKTEPRGLE